MAYKTTYILRLGRKQTDLLALQPEFRQIMEESIHKIIMTIPELKKEYPKLKSDWNFEHDFDFIYGCIVGQILGSCFTAFKMLHNREATPDEILTVGEIIESYFNLIREEILRT